MEGRSFLLNGRRYSMRGGGMERRSSAIELHDDGVEIVGLEESNPTANSSEISG